MKKRSYDFMEHMPDVFHPNDYALSNLACRAAVSIIRDIKNPLLRDYRPINRLGEIMYTSTEPDENYLSAPVWIPAKDDVQLSCFLADLFEVHTGKKPGSLEELVQTVRETALSILKLKELPKEKQRDLAMFCLELSKEAMSYWQESHPHGFRQYVA